MYATQPILPRLRAAFGATEALVARTVSSLTFACAIAGPFAGILADRLGRKRVIIVSVVRLGIATSLTSTATNLRELVAWRFVQGLFMPGIFAATLAYIAKEYPSAMSGRVVGAYIAGSVFGGFIGRYVASIVAVAESWRSAFLWLTALNCAGAAVVALLLPRASARRILHLSRGRRSDPEYRVGSSTGSDIDGRCCAPRRSFSAGWRSRCCLKRHASSRVGPDSDRRDFCAIQLARLHRFRRATRSLHGIVALHHGLLPLRRAGCDRAASTWVQAGWRGVALEILFAQLVVGALATALRVKGKIVSMERPDALAIAASD